MKTEIKIQNIKIGTRFRKDIGDLTELKNSIKEIGLLHPIVIDKNNNLIAGLRRLKAFEELGKEKIPVNVVDIENIVRGEYDENLVRKNFVPSECVAIWEVMESYQFKKGGRSDSDQPEQRRKQAVKITGYSTDTLSKAKQIVEYKDKELIKKMDKTGNVNKIYKEVKKAKRIANVEKQARNYKPKNDDIKIWLGDFRERTKEIEDGSIDLILTDPPYPEEYLPLWQDLFKIANRVLKPSGFLVTYSGHIYLDKIFKMPNDLIYYWIMCLFFDGGPSILVRGRSMIEKWKPILIFQKSPFKEKKDGILEDVIRSEHSKDRELHNKNWGQTSKPFEVLIERFSKVGDLVLDPFAGTGTTLVACKNKKRRAIGIEIERQYIDIIKGRLKEF